MVLDLISSLERDEKRFFTTLVRREGGLRDQYYLLYRHLADGHPAETFPVKSANQLSNHLRQLHRRLLDALRGQHRRRDPAIQLREQLDHANLLYDRGLHGQALRILAAARLQADRHHLDAHQLLVVNLIKLIESRHITRSATDRMDELVDQSRRLDVAFSATVQLSNLQLQLQRHFIQHGHPTDQLAADRFRQRYAYRIERPLPAQASLRERIYRYRCTFWYHYNLLELDAAAAAARHWVALFDAGGQLRERDVNFLIQGLDRLLLTAFFRNHADEHRAARRLLSELTGRLATSRRQRENSRRLAAATLLRADLSQPFLDANYAYGYDRRQDFDRRIRGLTGGDPHENFVNYYKLAVLCARSAHFEDAIDYLRHITEAGNYLRYDVAVYARLLTLCCRYRLGQHELARYGTANLARYLARVRYPSPYPGHVLQLLRNLARLPRPAALEAYRSDTAALRADPLARRELRYFTIEGLL